MQLTTGIFSSLRLLSIVLLFSLRQISLPAQVHLNLIGHLPYNGATLAGCWHHVDGEGNEYALVGTSTGLSIVNLNEPTSPYEIFQVPASINNWREVKTYGGYAYVSTEAANSGITIVDLNHLPDSISSKVWTGDAAHTDMILSAHALAATDGFLYVFGSKPINNGAIICDLTDPWNPEIIGNYTNAYVHDGYIRNDTLWAGEVYNGQFSVIDVSDKTAPVQLATQPSPGLFNHNTWLSDDGNTLFTTDEKPWSPLAAFDIRDLGNITLLDTYYPSQLPDKEVHNVHVFNDFLINPSYGGQLTIVDAHKPDNLVEIAWALLGNSLVWDADPYLPSGIVFALAKNEGLFIYQPEYVRACYLEGLVTDSISGQSIPGATVRIVNTIVQDSTKVLGNYNTGYHTPGFWTIEVSHPDYQTKSIPMVSLVAGQITTLNVELSQAAVTSTNQERKPSFRVYPTSFLSAIHIESRDITQKQVYFEMTDLYGKLLYSAKLKEGKQSIELGAQWPVGYYLITFKGENGVLRTDRLVKQ